MSSNFGLGIPPLERPYESLSLQIEESLSLERVTPELLEQGIEIDTFSLSEREYMYRVAAILREPALNLNAMWNLQRPSLLTDPLTKVSSIWEASSEIGLWEFSFRYRQIAAFKYNDRIEWDVLGPIDNKIPIAYFGLSSFFD